MSKWQAEISRRPLLAALIGVAGIGVVGGGIYEAARHFGGGQPGAYDDLLARLADRDSAAIVGRAVIADLPKFNEKMTARELRRKIGKRSLADVTKADLADGQLAEAGGWVLPQTVALICALAA